MEDKLIEEKGHALLNKLKKAEKIKIIKENKIKQIDFKYKSTIDYARKTN